MVFNRTVILPALMMGALAGFCLAQGENPHLAFEVASVKRLEVPRVRTAFPPDDPGRVIYPSVTFSFMVQQPYDVWYYQIDGPSWIRSEWYDLDAKLPEGASRSDIPRMLQNLLTESFGLKAHRESKTQSAYVLLVGKNGPKLKKSDEGPAMKDSNGNEISSTFRFSNSGSFESHRITMKQFARALMSYLHEPVFNMTNIEGKFDVTIEANPLNDNTSASIFTAVQELGLKLESRKVPIEHIVIDHAEKTPTEN